MAVATGKARSRSRSVGAFFAEAAADGEELAAVRRLEPARRELVRFENWVTGPWDASKALAGYQSNGSSIVSNAS